MINGGRSPEKSESGFSTFRNLHQLKGSLVFCRQHKYKQADFILYQQGPYFFQKYGIVGSRTCKSLIQDLYVVFILYRHGGYTIKVGDFAGDNDLFAAEFLVRRIAEVNHLVLKDGDGKNLIWKLFVQCIVM